MKVSPFLAVVAGKDAFFGVRFKSEWAEGKHYSLTYRGKPIAGGSLSFLRKRYPFLAPQFMPRSEVGGC